ncbi:hypothetical protein [Planotetraspora kaengkrachanensis]|uniref:Uncharacterized protein n=1 Tax=Planotetraspora kaengkrachanensis TaxID=575193 RepID=A0A8J3VCJ9_9ACTN|nr:hypothetical protein [Planotetraspora kaengkrachanensis]GIG84853.1 hypothetical protein Pka01_79800 [Planotetraspora kaengkrachanensis]
MRLSERWMGDGSVRRSQARRRTVIGASAAGVVGAVALVGGLSAIGASADTRTVAYVCLPSAPATATASPDLTAALSGQASATPSEAVTLTWTNRQPSDTDQIITVPTEIATTDRIVIVGDLVVSGPGSGAKKTIQATATGTPGEAVPSGSPVPLPTLTAVITPTATGTVGVKADAFTLKVGPADGTPETWYDCSISTVAAANTSPASLSIKVSPQATRTVYETVTAQVSQTPTGGAATGGGAEAGPDGRVFILTGSALVLAAAVGGLLMRTRRRAVRH